MRNQASVKMEFLAKQIHDLQSKVQELTELVNKLAKKESRTLDK